ncbi:hypothetical protein X801_00749 [Opisthorchis viverrini]|uniref:Sperm microtubule inner protein 1 C-terminal domain-containing protein n=1 Tax=Opisthorchis viverrini TaxID=6198 RepID=A0A1S8X9I5_OPIVI|nr:hypothetical protein X801_00749 [Opisthorchis viverrini]
MSRNFPADTRAQRALEEQYERELTSQISWFLKHQQAKKTSPGKPLSPEEISETKVSNPFDLLPKHVQEKIIACRAREKKPTKAVKKPSESKESVKELPPDMIPPEPYVLKTLYDGISKEGRGRYKYLTERNRLDMEQKYRYPILSSMEYGWGHRQLLKECPNLHTKRHGRVQVIRESFYQRNGLSIEHCADML